MVSSTRSETSSLSPWSSTPSTPDQENQIPYPIFPSTSSSDLLTRHVELMGFSSIESLATSTFSTPSNSPCSTPREKTIVQILWEELKEKSKSIDYGYIEKDPNPIGRKNYESRYSTILCPTQTAIYVEIMNSQNQKKILYALHANHIKHPKSSRNFVASQAPYKSEIPSFWRYIVCYPYSHSIPCIIDLTNIGDLLRDRNLYYPKSSNEVKNFEGITISLSKQEGPISTYAVELPPKTLESKSISVRRYHFNKWPDQGVVDLPTFRTLINDIKNIFPEKAPLWVHCKAGLGRTGTLITTLIIDDLIHEGAVTSDNIDNSLVDLILDLRKMRGEGFVQTEEQFNLIREYALSLLDDQKLETDITET